MKISVKHILIARADHIGDLILSLPMATYLKQLFPGVKITLIAQEYVRGIAEVSSSIDNFISIEETEVVDNPLKAEKILLEQNADVCIDLTYNISHVHGPIRYLFSKFVYKTLNKKVNLYIKRKRVHGLALYLLYIKNMFLKNQYFNFIFKKEYKDILIHEIYRNLILLKSLGVKTLPLKKEIASLYKLDTGSIRLTSAIEKLLTKDKFNLILHPKSHGNGIEWPLDNYAELINKLDTEKFRIFITGSQKELPDIKYIIDKLGNKDCAINLGGQFSNPAKLVAFINKADGLIASSTGPMHISAALGKNTLGIFPCNKQTKSFRRWHHNSDTSYNGHFIVNEDINQLTPDVVHEAIKTHFLKNKFIM
ncbi:MAG: glycosyltransferase family 9 protein [Solitalea-like symbiont of Tyrophagus putrescentiae]